MIRRLVLGVNFSERAMSSKTSANRVTRRRVMRLAGLGLADSHVLITIMYLSWYGNYVPLRTIIPSLE